MNLLYSCDIVECRAHYDIMWHIMLAMTALRALQQWFNTSVLQLVYICVNHVRVVIRGARCDEIGEEMHLHMQYRIHISTNIPIAIAYLFL